MKIQVGEVEYHTAPWIAELNVTSHFGGPMEIRTIPPQMRLINKCKSCGRSDAEEIVAYNIKEAIQLNWLEEYHGIQ